ncbi:MAG: 16S rRNA (uracil(1498)-N(3))-methyltransferase [Gammaproteobacteria bacterium]
MNNPRIFQSIPLHSNQILELDNQASHHLLRVLRLKVGNPITLFNGEGGEYGGQLCVIKRNRVSVKVGDFRPHECESPCAIHLAQAISKSASMDLIVQKAVELGVHTITPILSQHCTIKTTPAHLQKRRQHWQAIIINASEQCGRNTLTQINPPIDLSPWLQQKTTETKLLLDPNSKQCFTTPLPKATQINLLIGPEGGFSESENQLAQKQGYLAVNLGPRILRCETAVLAAISLAQSCWGDLSDKSNALSPE